MSFFWFGQFNSTLILAPLQSLTLWWHSNQLSIMFAQRSILKECKKGHKCTYPPSTIFSRAYTVEHG